MTGRTYPVEVRYRPFGDDADDDRDQVQAVVDAVGELGREGRGDVLVFLSGEREIRDTADALAPAGPAAAPRCCRCTPGCRRPSSTGSSSPTRGRRVVLATNVAETSLTVPGVRYVVDAGTARISRYSRRLKVQRLPIEPISQASANQRAGRCGRVATGHLHPPVRARTTSLARPEFTEPEILRTNLAVGHPADDRASAWATSAAFPFVEPPDRAAVRDGYLLLEELGAIDAARATTARVG